MDNTAFPVYVRCSTYNHAKFIVDAMNGFTMQQTSLPYVCAIIDDASTDSEQEVIRNYFQEHFDLTDKETVRHEETDDYLMSFARHKTNNNCFFAVFYLKYNHYSINKDNYSYASEWADKAKYYAICEGDDYWIDPGKLQKQIDFLECHEDYTMTCNRTQLYSVKKQKIIGENYCYNCSRDIDPVDVINRTGLFISTCSIVYRREVLNNQPEYWEKCEVGDYPLQIACAMKGKTMFFNEIMSVYRVENPTSWMGQQQWRSASLKRLRVIKSQVEMFWGFAHDYPEYNSILLNKSFDQINRFFPRWNASKEDKESYINYFKSYIDDYSWIWKIELFLLRLKVPIIRSAFRILFLRNYNEKKKLY